MSTIMSRRDLDFLLHEWLGTDELLARPRYADHSRDTVDAVLDLAEQVATTEFAPHNRLSDLTEPTYDGTTVTVIPEVGGGSAPQPLVSVVERRTGTHRCPIVVSAIATDASRPRRAP